MQKRDSKPIEAADLSEYLESADDFQFELEVFRCCLQGGLPAEHGGTYQDPVTKKDRQFDIRMLIKNRRRLVKLAIECKNLKTNFPLLVSRIPRRPEENFHMLIFSSRITGVRSFRVSGPATVFEAGKLVGKSTAQVGRTPSTKKNIPGDLVTSDAEVYEKWTQALGSAFDLVYSSRGDYVTEGDAAVTVIFPVLVIPDETLWTVDYSADGQQLSAPKRSHECEVFLGKNFDAGSLNYTTSHLLIFTKTKFDSYLNRLATNEKYLALIFPPQALEGRI